MTRFQGRNLPSFKRHKWRACLWLNPTVDTSPGYKFHLQILSSALIYWVGELTDRQPAPLTWTFFMRGKDMGLTPTSGIPRKKGRLLCLILYFSTTHWITPAGQDAFCFQSFSKDFRSYIFFCLQDCKKPSFTDCTSFPLLDNKLPKT